MEATERGAFGVLLREHRADAGLTQEELAERAGLSARVVSDLERGVTRAPQRHTIQRLAEALGLSEECRARFQSSAPRRRRSIPFPRATEAVQKEAPGIRTFLIADIRGYTRFTQEQGDQAGARLAAQLADLVEQTVTPSQGQLIELRGDEALVVFSSARQALRAAVELQGLCDQQREQAPCLPLNVGIGLDAGEAVPVKGGYRGRALNLAARLCDLAGRNSAGRSEVFCSDTVIALAGPVEGLIFVDRGEVRIKNLGGLIQVIQVGREEDPPADLPHLQQASAAYRTNLPVQPTPFIGRDRDIAEVTALLRRGDARLLTLTGPGGTGKTRLALQAAHEVLRTFPDGVFFVSLARIADPDFVASTIAATLEVKEIPERPLAEMLKDYLRDKQMLLVLDNFEHVLDARSLVGELLASCPTLTVLITSRAVLRLSAEHVSVVPPLAVPNPTCLPDLEALSQYDAVALFIERANAATGSFTVTSENALAVAEICYRLDGLPLAIELAAACVRVFPPQALLKRLGSRLTLLTGGARDAPARLQTLRGAIDWSYSLLDAREQRLFNRLSVFAGGCTLEAAENVCNAEREVEIDMVDGVTSLVGQSLLRQEGKEEPRFVMLETIREYAAERLEASREGEPLRRRHAAYYLALAEQAEPELTVLC